jgi:hypothetical protein
MSIKDLQPELLNDLRTSDVRRSVTRRIHLIYEESIEPEVKRSLRLETSKDRKYQQLISRIPDINMIKKVTDKLAKVYNKPAVRKVKTGTATDQELVDYYSSALSLDHKLNIANKILEWGRMCALELYLDSKTGKPKMRVLAPYQVRAYSNDPDDPMSVTAVTKIMGQKTIRSDLGGPKTVNIYHTFTDDEFMIWNEEEIVSIEPNPIGKIPFIWLNKSEFLLNSYAPESDINSAVLIPKSYADIYYAMAYSAHSVWAAIDLVLPEKLDHDPGAIMDLKTDTDGMDGLKQGRLETVKPSIDIAGSLELIKQTVFDMLESRGIKPPQTTSSLERPNASAALIENADASSYIIQSCAYFQRVEESLWELIRHMHNNLWMNTDNGIEVKKNFSATVKLDVVFAEVKPIEVTGTQLDNLKKQMDMGLMSRKQALAERYPHFTEAQLDAWLAEAESEAEADAQKEAEIAANSQPTQLPVGGTTRTGGAGNNSQDSGSDT